MGKFTRLFSKLSTGAPDEDPQRRGGTSKVQDAKKPKSRPPTGLRDKLGFIHGCLPKYSGPYVVSTMEIEVPARNPGTFSHLTRHGQAMLKLETVLMTVYYPGAHGTGAGPAPSGHSKWSRETWLPRPRVSIAQGYGKFAGIGPIAIPFFGISTMFTKLPAYRNAGLAHHWPPSENLLSGGVDVKNSEGPPPEGLERQPCYPLMMFSHGLGGTRTMYSSLCGEFASYGFIVIAVEHRDGSGPRTFVNHAPDDAGNSSKHELHIEKLKENETAVKRKRGYDKIDYYFPKDNAIDTAPNNEKGVDHELRSAQIDLRMAEVEEAYHVMCEIARGNGEEIARKNLRRKGYTGGSSEGLKGVDWNQWKGRVHLKQVTMTGHSFGAATTVEILRDPKRFYFVSQGIILDIWSAGMKAADPKNSPENRIKLPVLAINSEAFSYWKQNYDPVKNLVEEAREEDALAWLMTVRGTVHINHSDFGLLYPHLCSMFLKMTADPLRALDLNIKASLEFLQIVMPARMSQINRAYTSEGILESDVLEDFDDLPDNAVHRPNGKWIAARLKIPHELRWRLHPRLRKERRHVRNHRGTKGGLWGLGDPCNETWMHMAPSNEQLERQGVRTEEERSGPTNETVTVPNESTQGNEANQSRRIQDQEMPADGPQNENSPRKGKSEPGSDGDAISHDANRTR